MSRQTLAEVIRAAVEELFSLVQQVLARLGIRGAAVFGSGADGWLLGHAGHVELGEEIFHMPVRVGVPRYTGGLAEVCATPRFATAVGLVWKACRRCSTGNFAPERLLPSRSGEDEEWFQRNF